MIATSSQTPPSAAPIRCFARAPCSTTSCRTCPNSNWPPSSNASPRCSPTNRSSPILSGPSENEGSLQRQHPDLERAPDHPVVEPVQQEARVVGRGQDG